MMRVYETSLWWPILSGVLLALTLPYVGGWPLVWFALVPLFLFATNSALPYGRLMWGTTLFGMIYALAVIFPLARISGWWWSDQVGVFGELGRQVLFSGTVGAVGLWGALFFLPLIFLVRIFDEKPLGAIVIALGWVIVEWLRSAFALFGYSWGVLGYTLIDTEYLKHVASLSLPSEMGGVYALSFVIILGNLVFVELFRLMSARSGNVFERMRNTLAILLDDGRRYFSFWFFIVLFIAILGYGMFCVYNKSGNGTLVRVAVIASQIPTEASIGEGAYRSYRTKLESAFASGAQIIVTPENVFPFFEINEMEGTLNKNGLIRLESREQLYEDFTALLRAHPTTTLVVGLHTTGESRERYNSIVYYKGGAPTQYYHKRKLVPYTEYIPFGATFPLPVRFVSGAPKQFADIDGVRIGALLCSEVGDTTIPLRDVGLIASPSNDSVFVGNAAAAMHHQMARMRALEASAYMLRASKGGVSSIIDSEGRVLMSGGDGVLVADIRVEI